MIAASRLPDFLVIGAQKAGTTSLFRLLEEHPGFAMATPKEVHFFSKHYHRGADWYRSRFPAATAGQRVGEATPIYLFWPRCLERIRELLPDVRLVVLLREPGARAYSHYQHEVALGWERRPFEQTLEEEEPILAGELAAMARDPDYFSIHAQHFSYLARGRYAEQLAHLYRVFPRSQVHVTACERLFAGDTSALGDLLGFLGATARGDEALAVHYARSYEPMPAAARAWLDDYYAEHNRALAALLDSPPPWCDPRGAAKPPTEQT